MARAGCKVDANSLISSTSESVEEISSDSNDEEMSSSDTDSISEDNTAFFESTKEYLLSEDNEVVEWDEDYVDAVDFDEEYALYLNEGGAEGDVTSFAKHLCEYAPAPDNWKELFEKSLLENYDVVPDHYEDLGDGLYQVYVEVDGDVVPYVAVNCHTGWYHE